MRTWILFILTLLTGYFTGNLPVSAQEPRRVTPLPAEALARAGTTRAVVVGISDYQDPDIPDLRFADRDAAAFANFLRSPTGGSLDGNHLKLLTNQQATAGQVIVALTWLLQESKEGDQAFIYFSGHGDVEAKLLNQLGFLLLWDSPAHAYLAGALPVDMLRQVVSTLSIELKTKVFVVVDACRAGKLAGNTVVGTQLTSNQLAQQFSHEQKVLSCQPNEFSIEGEQWGGGRGVFSFHLCNGLYGLADADHNGRVSLFEIGRYLEDRVPGDVAPLSQLPLTVGDKLTPLFSVHGPTLAALEKQGIPSPIIAPVEQRGMLQEVMAKADSSIRGWYAGFERTLRDKQFFEPKGNCTEYFFQKLSETKSIAALHPMLSRNYAAALQDDAQQVLNIMLKSGLTEQVLRGSSFGKIYNNYPAYLKRAGELLGKSHYMHNVLRARVHFFEGMTLDKSENKRTAFQIALQWQPDMPHALVELLRNSEAGQLDSAKWFFQKATTLAPTWVEPYIAMAEFYRQKLQQLDKAEEMLNLASQVDSASILVKYVKGRFYDGQQKYKQAEAWYLKALVGTAGDICFPCTNQALGSIYMNTGRMQEAEQYFFKAISQDSTFVLAQNGLATVYLYTDRLAEAEKYFLKTIALDSTFVHAVNNLGSVYQNTSRSSEAEKYFLKSLAIDSTFWFAYANLAALYQKLQRWEASEIMARNSIAFAPPIAGLVAVLGNAQTHLPGRLADAKTTLEKALALDAAWPDTYIYLAQLALKNNQTEEAWLLLEKGLENGFGNGQLPPSALYEGPDFEGMRKAAQWKALMKKHFPEQVKD